LDVREEKGLLPEKTISLPRTMITPHNTLQSLINIIYPNIAIQLKPDSFFLDRTILTAKNDAVDAINAYLLYLLLGEIVTLLDFDTIIDVANA
jgi:hypothetical protein